MEICIQKIRAQNAGAEIALVLTLSDGEHSETRELILTTEQYGEFRPEKGRITEEFFDRLESAASLTSAIKRGSYILGYGTNSRRTLVQKLNRRGFTREQSEAAAEYLAERNYINESSDAVREAETDLGKLWGRRRIMEHLRSRGYGRDALADAETFLDEIDFAANCRILVKKRYRNVPTDRASRQKLYAALLRYGYTMSEIHTACGEGAEDFSED